MTNPISSSARAFSRATAFVPSLSFARSTALWLVLVCVCTAFITSKQLRSPIAWPPDGFLYGRMMQVDLGAPESQARDTTRAFYLTTPDGRAERARLYSRDPPGFFEKEYHLFSGRILYPYIASKLYRWFGFGALIYTSAIAYLLSALALFWLLGFFGPPWLAGVVAIGTTAALRQPLAASPGTDTLAYLFFIGVLVAMTGYVKMRHVGMLVILGLSCVLLALTRPSVYLPIGAALGVFALAAKTKDADQLRLGRTFTAITASAALLYLVVSLAVHAPGLFDQLRWLYGWQRDIHARFTEHGFLVWYPWAIATASIHAFSQSLSAGTPIVAALIAVLGLSLHRNDATVPVFYGASAASLFAVIANPIDLSRTIGLPLAPVLAVGIVMAAEALLLQRQHS